jgi:hypothetical protein
MLAALDRHPGCAVGVHGAKINEPVKSYRESLAIIAHFRDGLARDRRVHVLGTGTMAYRPSDLTIPMALFAGFSNATDAAVAVYAKERGVPLWAVERPGQWLEYLKPPGKALWDRELRRDSTASELVRRAAPWPVL